MKLLPLVGAIIAGASIVSGCSNSGSPAATAPTGPTTFPRVAALAAQTAMITIATPTTTPTVTVTTQPANMTLSGTATVVGADVTVVLTATNNAGRVISNLKAVVNTAGGTNLQGGTITTSSGATAGGDDFVSFNTDADSGLVKSVADAASAGADDLVITTVAATDITLDVSLPTEDVSLLIGGSFGGGTHDYYTVDSTGDLSDFEHDGLAHAYSQAQAAAGFRASAPHPDGTKFFLGTRQRPAVVVHDNVTGTSTSVNVSREGRIGAIHGLTVSPDTSYLYVSLVDGGHSYASDGGGGVGSVWIIKLRIDTMEEVGALEVLANGASTRIQPLSITTDGTTGAAPLFQSGGVAIINLDDMTLTKIIDVTTVAKALATPPFSAGIAMKPRFNAISPDGAYVYVAHQYDYDGTGIQGDLEVYNVADGTGARVALTTDVDDDPRGLEFDSAGNLFFVRDMANPVSKFSFAAADYSMPTGELEVTGGTGGDALAFGPYGKYYYVQLNGSTAYKFDASTDTLDDTITGIGGSQYHVLSVSAY